MLSRPDARRTFEFTTKEQNKRKKVPFKTDNGKIINVSIDHRVIQMPHTRATTATVTHSRTNRRIVVVCVSMWAVSGLCRARESNASCRQEWWFDVVENRRNDFNHMQQYASHSIFWILSTPVLRRHRTINQLKRIILCECECERMNETNEIGMETIKTETARRWWWTIICNWSVDSEASEAPTTKFVVSHWSIDSLMKREIHFHRNAMPSNCFRSNWSWRCRFFVVAVLVSFLFSPFGWTVAARFFSMLQAHTQHTNTHTQARFVREKFR